MKPCTDCGRHIRDQEDRCPFCSAPGLGSKIYGTVAAMLTPLVLAACYGGPPCEGSTDVDGDGYTTECGDCDDANDQVGATDASWTEYAAIPEDCTDGFDNDCNGLIDAEDPACEGVIDTDPDTDPDTDVPVDTDISVDTDVVDSDTDVVDTDTDVGDTDAGEDTDDQSSDTDV